MMKTNGGFLVSQIKQIQGRVFERMLVRSGIEEFNGAQGRILYVLWQEDHLPIMEISRRTGLAKTTLTSMLDRMEKRGFLTREVDPADRRQVRLILTEKMKALNGRYEDVSGQMSEIFYQGFTEEEIVKFEEQLHRIIKNLSEEESRQFNLANSGRPL